MYTRLFVGILVMLGVATLGGCSKHPLQASVRGQVKFDGSPVDGGQIRFIPSGTGHSPVDAPIVEGKYEILASHGPEVGKCIVEIRWSRKTGKKFNSPPLGLVEETRQVIPSAYNDQSRLQCELQVGDNEYNADLKSR